MSKMRGASRYEKVVVVFLILCLITSGFVSCNEQDDNGTTKVSDEIGVTTTELYEVTPASSASASNNYALQSSFRDDTYWYYIYYLGRVRGVPVGESSITTNAFHYSGNTEIVKELKITEMTNETVAKAIEKSNSVTNGWSEDLRTALNSSLSGTVSTTEKVTASADLGLFGGSAEASVSASVTATIQTGLEEKLGITSSEQNTLVQYETTEKSKTYTSEKTMTFRFIPNESREGWYKYTMVGTVDVFAVVIYNPTEQNASITAISEWAALYEELVYSEDEFFTSNADKLTLNTESIAFTQPTTYYKSVGQEQLKPNPNPDNTAADTAVEIDLSAFYSTTNTTASLTGFAHEFFNYETGVFTLKDTYGGKQVTKYIFKGLYNKPNSNGILYKTVLENFAIVLDREQNIEIVLENIALQGKAGQAVISLVDGKSFQNTVKITVRGECLILGANGVDASANSGNAGLTGTAAIDFSTSNNVSLVLSGDGVLTVRGGNGGKGGVGGNGAAGIAVNRLEVTSNLTLAVYGGDGGKGGNGGNSVNIYWGSANPSGSGAVGGKGALAITAPSVIISGNANVSACGGNGGNGGYCCTYGADGSVGSGASGGAGSAALASNVSVSGNLSACVDGTNGVSGSKGGDWNSQGNNYNTQKYWEN